MGCSVSLMSVDFPDPLTPVTTISVPRGKSMSTFFRLLPDAPFIVIFFPLPFLLFSGMVMLRVPLRYSPVMVGCFISSFGVPWNTTSPPFLPALGPMSIT